VCVFLWFASPSNVDWRHLTYGYLTVHRLYFDSVWKYTFRCEINLDRFSSSLSLVFLQQISGPLCLMSSSQPEYSRLKLGARAFVAGPRVWNQLATNLSHHGLTDTFRHNLDTFLFSSAYPQHTLTVLGHQLFVYGNIDCTIVLYWWLPTACRVISQSISLQYTEYSGSTTHFLCSCLRLNGINWITASIYVRKLPVFISATWNEYFENYGCVVL